jgi:hypothetical protein
MCTLAEMTQAIGADLDMGGLQFRLGALKTGGCRLKTADGIDPAGILS